VYTHAIITPPSAGNLVAPLDLMRAHCRVSHRFDDSLLAMYCQAATIMVESYTARSLLTQTLRMTSTATLPPASVPMSQGPIMVLPLWFNTILTTPYRRIELIRSPVTLVRSISITQYDGSIETLDPSLYMVDTDTDPGAIVFTGFTLLPMHRLNVIYDAGYSADSVPVPLINAVLWLVGYLYSHRGDDEINELPALMRRLCDPYRISFFGGISPDGR
jgi:hypothetical protein